MAERSPKLPFAATFVIWASRLLTLGEKVVWYQIWALDITPANGCYIGADKLAERLGIAVGTVEQYRTRLRKLDLLGTFARRDAKNLGWYASLPPTCVPIGRRAAGDEGVRLARLLDKHIEERDRWEEMGGASSRTRVRPQTPPTVVPGPDRESHDDTTEGTECVREGGIKGGPTSSSVTASQLLPVVEIIEDGVVAHATSEGGVRLPGETTIAMLDRLSQLQRRKA